MTALRELRRAARMTQQELAQLTGVSQPMISTLERGLVPTPRSRNAQALAESFGLGFEDVFGAVEKRR